MASVIHMDQTFCVPKSTIFDNLFLMRDMITVAKNKIWTLGLYHWIKKKHLTG